MDVRLEDAGRSLGNFLEDDLSGAYLGLAPAARIHLDRFRSFLHSFYVGKYGYWPPTRSNTTSAALPKPMFRSMYFEFRNLYEYLVDGNSNNGLSSDRPADGGICVLQNITAFDKRRKYTSLPHTLPLIPEIPLGHRRTNTVRKLFKYSHAHKNERRAATLAALSAATNPSDVKVMECRLVREYLRFEKAWTLQDNEEAVSCSDARKVRWILIYAVLQILISVTRAPPEVRDTEGVPYPLCCQIAGTPPWDGDGKKASEKKVTLKQKLVAMGEEEIRKAKVQQDEMVHPALRVTDKAAKVEAPSRKVDFTTPFLELSPDHADLFIPKPMPLFSSPNIRNNSFTPFHRPAALRNNSFSPAQPNTSPVPSTTNTSPRRPRALTLPQQISITRDLSLRSPQPQRPGFVDSLITKYSQSRLPNFSATNSPSHSASSSESSSRNTSAPSSGDSSPGGASVSSASQRGNSSPVDTSTPVSSSAREEDSSTWSETSYEDEDGMEHMSITSAYEEDSTVPESVKPAVEQPKRWDSVRSVAQLGRSNPEVDAYVLGLGR